MFLGYNCGIMWEWSCTFAVIASAIVAMAYEQHYAREEYQAKSQTDCVALAVSIEEKHTCAKDAQSRKDYAPWWYILEAWPEGITTWAIIGTGFVIAWQSSETRKAAKATEVASEAAAKSTAAFINKERSRLFIRTEVTNEFCATFYAENRGNSPARITYGFVGCDIFTDEGNFPDIPDYARGDPAWVFGQNEWVLPKGESRIGNYDADYISVTENPDLFNDIMSGKDKVWFYGVVRYTDSVSEDEHEVRFCYRTWIREDGSLFILGDGPQTYRLEK